MLRYGLSAVIVCLALSAAGSWSAPAFAHSAHPVSPFISTTAKRTIQGDARALDLSAAGYDLGNVQAFAGVDTLSTASRQYLTSGLQWRISSADTARLNLTALRTEGRGDLRGGQTLARAESAFDLGGRWYMPDVTAEVAQVRNSSPSGARLGGRAIRVGLADTLGNGRLSLDYFRAAPDFDALDSSLESGARGLALGGRYPVGHGWRLTHDVRLHQETDLHPQSALVQEWSLAQAPRPDGMGDPWQFTARIGDSDDPALARHASPIALNLAAQSAHWRSWRLDSAIGWYDGGARAPRDLPVTGGLWRFSARRHLTISGWRTRISPRLALGGSRDPARDMASSTGLTFGVARLSDNIDFSVNYLSAGWNTAATDTADMQMSVEYTRSTGGIIPSLASVINHLRLPWQRRR